MLSFCLQTIDQPGINSPGNQTIRNITHGQKKMYIAFVDSIYFCIVVCSVALWAAEKCPKFSNSIFSFSCSESISHRDIRAIFSSDKEV